MISPLPLMAASLLLGQTGPVPVNPAPAGPTYVYSNGQLVPSDSKATIVTEAPPENRRPFLSRIKSWFSKGNSNPTTPTPSYNTFPSETAPPPLLGPAPTPLRNGVPLPATSPTSTDLPRKLPISRNGASGGDAISPAALQGLPTPAPSPILPANVNRIGRDEKFEWVTGQVEMEKGQLVLYYATPETVDPHHGRLLLNAHKVDMRPFHSGDLISVRGSLLQGRGVTIYQLTSADLIEKAKR